jgi:hypothetical protein
VTDSLRGDASHLPPNASHRRACTAGVAWVPRVSNVALGLAPPGLALVLEAARHTQIEQQRGQPIATILARCARAAYALVDLANELLASLLGRW